MLTKSTIKYINKAENVTQKEKLLFLMLKKERVVSSFFSSLKYLLIAGLLLLSLLNKGAFAGGLEGKEAPDFKGENLLTKEGVDYNEELKGKKVVLLDFWSIYCTTCLQEIPKLIEIYHKYKDKDIYFISVNMDTISTKRIKEYLRKNPQPYTVFLDKEKALMNAFDVKIMPSTIIIGKDGMVKLHHNGFAAGSEELIEEVIKGLLE